MRDMRRPIGDIPQNHRIFVALKALAETGKPTDCLSALDELERTNLLEAAGGVGYLAQLGDDSLVFLLHQFLKNPDAHVWLPGARVVHQETPLLRELLPSISTPAQIIAGREDELVPWSNNEYLAELLPNSEIHPLDAGHFAWEQASEEYGRLIVKWVTGGFEHPGD